MSDYDYVRNFIVEAKLLSDNMRAGLYYFHCQPLLRKDPPEFRECRPRFYRPACLVCFVKAGKALADYRKRGE